LLRSTITHQDSVLSSWCTGQQLKPGGILASNSTAWNVCKWMRVKLPSFLPIPLKMMMSLLYASLLVFERKINIKQFSFDLKVFGCQFLSYIVFFYVGTFSQTLSTSLVLLRIRVVEYTKEFSWNARKSKTSFVNYHDQLQLLTRAEPDLGTGNIWSSKLQIKQPSEHLQVIGMKIKVFGYQS